MEWMGYAAAILIGISLGLIGAGGSILTVPVLVYLFSIPASVATTYSLFIVGLTSVAGAARNMQLIQWRTVFLFGSTSIISVLLTRRFLLPFIPDTITTIGEKVITQDLLTLTLFAVVMIVAAVSMIRKPDADSTEEKHRSQKEIAVRLMIQGVIVGIVTGLLGAGGGFLIVPVLVLLRKLPMKRAVATSLTIIAINSLIGFFGGSKLAAMDWRFLITIAAIAMAGIFVGIFLSKKISGTALKKGFGWFVLTMGFIILIKEWTGF